MVFGPKSLKLTLSINTQGLCKLSRPNYQELDGYWSQKAQMLGTWTLWVDSDWTASRIGQGRALQLQAIREVEREGPGSSFFFAEGRRYSSTQRVQLDCQYGIRAQNPCHTGSLNGISGICTYNM